MDAPPPSAPSTSNDTVSDALQAPGAGRATNFLGRHPRLRRMAMRLLDACLLACTFILAYLIRFLEQTYRNKFLGFSIPATYTQQLIYLLPYVLIVRLLLLQLFGAYRGFTRYTGLHEIVNLFIACSLGSCALVIFNASAPHISSLPSLAFDAGDHPHLAFWFPPFPRDGLIHRHILKIPTAVLIVEWMLSLFSVATPRIAWRVFAERLILLRRSNARRVLIVGAGDAGEQVARDLLRAHTERYRPVGFVSSDVNLLGRRIHGIPVLGTLEGVEQVITAHSIGMVIVALANPAPRLLRSLVDHCRQARIEFKIIPDLNRMLEGRVQISQLRPVEIEDLLGRPPVTAPNFEEQSCVRGKRVLVTGAGGSIGSELCRQALDQRAARLTLLGRGENSLYEIQHELAARAAAQRVPLEVVIGNVTDAPMIQRLFAEMRPEVILHAAAHKHVHFMEAQPAEAIKNNVLGTRTVAEAALAAGAEHFILISTDKAVRPTGVMGASKRIAEMLVSSLNTVGPTRFIAVRFGNVLGSRGSVIPLFRKQIAAGGPITVTHPEVTRYFMTIPEAVSLVLQAGAVGAGGEVFLLDMGQPVKIVDLARQLITLSGLEPGADIAIEFSGLRPGEKLYEELLTEDQSRLDTEHGKIFRSNQKIHPWPELKQQIETLEAAAVRGDTPAILSQLHALIPDYLGANSEASGK